MSNFWKSHKLGIIYCALLVAFTVYVGLDTFVIPHRIEVVDDSQAATEVAVENTQADEDSISQESPNKPSETTQSESGKHKPEGGPGKNHGEGHGENDFAPKENHETVNADTASETTELTNADYSDENISIKLSEEIYENTHIYVAEVILKSADYLKTAFAENTYGRNIKAYTSDIAAENNAILAINGDFYGAREAGYVIRNGVLYQKTGVLGNEDLMIDKSGSFSIVSEDEVSAEELLNDGAWQVLSFGPGLVEDGEITVSENDEVGQAMTSNPRTAIGEIEPLHYVFVVSDGRTDESAGLSLYELAGFMKSLNARTAYNLDGGGSSTLYFQGNVINNPTTNGGSIKERSVSDIVYIGY